MLDTMCAGDGEDGAMSATLRTNMMATNRLLAVCAGLRIPPFQRCIAEGACCLIEGFHWSTSPL